MVSFSCRISPRTSTVILRDRSPLRDGGRHFGDVAHLAGEVGGHRVDVVGQVLPGTRHAWDDRLAAELALGADFARHARDFGREAVELIDHRVDGVLQLAEFRPCTSTVILRDRSPLGDRGGDFGDVAHLAGEIGGHGVDRVGQILPGAGDARHQRLAAELAFGADLARHARDFGGEGAQLIDHRVDGVLELQDLAAHVDRDLARQVALGDRDRDFGDIADLAGEVARHRVDVVGEVLPGAARRPGTSAWPPSLPSVPTSRATRVTSAAKPFS